MPWYVFATPEGQVQLFAQNQQEAARILLDRTGLNRFGTEFSAQVAGIPVLSGGTGITDSGNVEGGLEAASRRGAFQRGLQRQGQNPEGFLSDYLENLYRPLTGAFDILGGGGRGSVDPENAFQSFVVGTPVGGVRQKATQAFRDIVNPGAAPNANVQEFISRYSDPYGQAGGEYDPETVENLIALAQQAAGTKYSPDAARRLLPNAETVRSRFIRGGLSSPFKDFLQKQYGLSGGF